MAIRGLLIYEINPEWYVLPRVISLDEIYPFTGIPFQGKVHVIPFKWCSIEWQKYRLCRVTIRVCTRTCIYFLFCLTGIVLWLPDPFSHRSAWFSYNGKDNGSPPYPFNKKSAWTRTSHNRMSILFWTYQSHISRPLGTACELKILSPRIWHRPSSKMTYSRLVTVCHVTCKARKLSLTVWPFTCQWQAVTSLPL